MRPAVYVDYYDKPAIRKKLRGTLRGAARVVDELGGTRGNLLLNLCTVNTNFRTSVGPCWANNLPYVISIDEQGIDAAERLGIVRKTKCPVIFHLTRAAEQSCQRTTSERTTNTDPFHTYRR